MEADGLRWVRKPGFRLIRGSPLQERRKRPAMMAFCQRGVLKRTWPNPRRERLQAQINTPSRRQLSVMTPPMQARQLGIVGLAASRKRARAVRRSVRRASLSRLDCATSGAEGGDPSDTDPERKGGFGLEMKRAGLLEIETEREPVPSECLRSPFKAERLSAPRHMGHEGQQKSPPQRVEGRPVAPVTSMRRIRLRACPHPSVHRRPSTGVCPIRRHLFTGAHRHRIDFSPG